MAFERVLQADGSYRFVEVAGGAKKSSTKSSGIPAWQGLYTWGDADVIAVEDIMVAKEGYPQKALDELRGNTNSEDESVRKSARGERTRNLNKILNDAVKAYIVAGTLKPVATEVKPVAKK